MTHTCIHTHMLVLSFSISFLIFSTTVGLIISHVWCLTVFHHQLDHLLLFQDQLNWLFLAACLFLTWVELICSHVWLFWSSAVLVLSCVLLCLTISWIISFSVLYIIDHQLDWFFLCLTILGHQLDWLFHVTCYFCPSCRLVLLCILLVLTVSWLISFSILATSLKPSMEQQLFVDHQLDNWLSRSKSWIGVQSQY